MYHSIPVLCIPIGGDQNDNAVNIERLGVGLMMNKKECTINNAPRIREKLVSLLTNESFQRQAQLTSARMRSHPRSSFQTAAEAVEYGINLVRVGKALSNENDHARFLKPPDMFMTSFEVHCFD
eukprot:CAMPEP_0182436122 /NCGR_PEP_ID=MMETSP1167-20130531/79613_1 /TAXON_ID=2988 /ORGANISM="Mallomonas Sp, Strain CCMP3275" /LENGTH=123 /DNA_ID=CAMNT_0024627909 /DNA_START=244 /DNA_END=612 /DNA_ORIENTATION=+